MQKNDSLLISNRKDFMKRSRSMKESVLSNKDQIEQYNRNLDDNRLRREN